MSKSTRLKGNIKNTELNVIKINVFDGGNIQHMMSIKCQISQTPKS